MTGFILPAAGSIAVGMSLGAAITVGATLAAADDHPVAPVPSAPSAAVQVQYGDRCFHGHCLPCDSVRGCLGRLADARR